MEIYFRHPKTAQEKRASQEHKGLIRAKRRPKNLVSEYDDIQPVRQRSWKIKRKLQRRTNHE